MNQAGNARYRGTVKSLQEALLALLEKKQLKSITVRELCEAAQINKATFYRHYQDIYELAEKTEQRIQSGLIRLLDTGKKRPLTEPIGQEELVRVIEYIGKYDVFYREYLKTGRDSFLDERFRHLWDAFFVPQFQAVGVTSERRMQYYYRFFRSGMLTVILYWLETGMQEPPQELASIIWRMSFHQLSAESGGGDRE
ncbi:MAG: TetR/AcrR family transcriptional regulator [Butyrivibrio sp.]|nr:TetR/AcrR family transcriptional regulator [Butyrivibrio sp.]MCM1344426.1 TetR/AcrR family transcriptional regulator [Muribaculaceae bacterium]